MRVSEGVFRAVINPLNGGLMARIAFHECGTFDYRGPPGRKGGCNGSIRYEFDWASNGGEFFLFVFRVFVRAFVPPLTSTSSTKGKKKKG